MQKHKKIVLIGGPGTGKTTVIAKLNAKGYRCFNEISREVILDAKKRGIDQLFLEDPILFSKLLLEGRERQYLDAEHINDIIFFDRGIPDVLAYLNYSNTEYPNLFLEKSKEYKYDIIFHFAPWEAIHKTDNERYENFNETKKIDTFLVDTYKKLGYQLINVPFGNIEDRVTFIVNTVAQLK